tara:strand:+ start:370 stop:684 length:315 start_codon:yes stop_codon:yes gene_type:complete
MIIEYMLIREMDRKRAPSWVEDGGYFMDPDDKTMIGWSPDLTDRDYYVPDSVIELNRAGLVARVQDINTRYPGQKLDESGAMVPMTDADIAATVNAWCDAHGEP